MSQSLEEALPRLGPASTQSHGTILLGVILGFVVLAVLLRLSIAGVGPLTVQLVDSRATGDTLGLTLRITNQGTRRAGPTA